MNDDRIMKLKIPSSGAGYYYWLDFFRVVAAILIVIGHVRAALLPKYAELPIAAQTLWTKLFYQITALGHESVILFFVISGFLVGGRSFVRIARGEFCWKVFLLERFSRIMLPLTGALLLFALSVLLMGGSVNWQDWWGTLLCVQGIFTAPAIGPLWFLAYEAYFYILVALCGIIFGGRSRDFTRLMAMLGVAAVFLAFSRLSPLYLFVFILGTLSFFTADQWRRNEALIGTALLVIQIAAISIFHPKWFYFNDLTTALLYCIIIRNAIHWQPRLKPFIAFEAWGHKTAKYAYSVYLNHMTFLFIRLRFVFVPSKDCSLSLIDFPAAQAYFQERLTWGGRAWAGLCWLR